MEGREGFLPFHPFLPRFKRCSNCFQNSKIEARDVEYKNRRNANAL
jgi:hypothetical protein